MKTTPINSPPLMLLLPPASSVADFTETELRAASRPDGVQGRDGGAGEVRDPEQDQVGQVRGAGRQGELQRGQDQSENMGNYVRVNREDKQKRKPFAIKCVCLTQYNECTFIDIDMNMKLKQKKNPTFLSHFYIYSEACLLLHVDDVTIGIV